MSVILNIILILASLVLIVAVLMQEGNKQGLGAIGGAAETFLGKNASKSYEGKLLNITRIGAVVFVVLAILATWLNARTYTVTYYDEDGNEYFPSLAQKVIANNFAVQYGLSEGGSLITYEEAYAANLATYTENGYTEEEMQKDLRTSYTKGKEVDLDFATPVKTGYNGVWAVDSNNDGVIDENDKGTLPEKMDRSNYVMRPVYTIGEYTVKIIDNGLQVEDVDDDATETVDEVAEDNVVFEMTANYGEAIDYGTLPLKPEQIDEYYVFYSFLRDAEAQGYIYNVKLPETIPGENTTIYVNYAHGNFITYFTAQNVVEKDEEGNAVVDENGNVVYVTDENGEIVTEEVEFYPDFINNLNYSVYESWDQVYAAQYGDDYMGYLTALEAAMAPDGEITQAVNNSYNALYEDYSANDTLDAMRSFVPFGTEIVLSGVPAKTGFVGYWDAEVPETMDGKAYELHAVYYPEVELTIIDDGIDGEKIPTEEEPIDVPADAETEEPAEEEEKHNVIFNITDGAGRTVDYGETVLPEAPEGYTVKWSVDELPEVMPEEDLVITVVYEPITEEEPAEETTEEPAAE